MKYITAVLILIQRNNQQNLQQVPACDISDQDWVSHAEIWDRLHLPISNKLSFQLNQRLYDLEQVVRRLGYHCSYSHRLLVSEIFLVSRFTFTAVRGFLHLSFWITISAIKHRILKTRLGCLRPDIWEWKQKNSVHLKQRS